MSRIYFLAVARYVSPLRTFTLKSNHLCYITLRQHFLVFVCKDNCDRFCQLFVHLRRHVSDISGLDFIVVYSADKKTLMLTLMLINARFAFKYSQHKHKHKKMKKVPFLVLMLMFNCLGNPDSPFFMLMFMLMLMSKCDQSCNNAEDDT